MLSEIWEPALKVVFVGTAIVEPSDTLGFYYLHPRDRFWELLELGGITPNQMITKQERKALTDGHARGNLSDPVRVMFLQKRTSQLLRLGIGITHLNRRVTAINEKDRSAKPTADDIQEFLAKVGNFDPKILAFVTSAESFLESFKSLYPEATGTPGLQPFSIGESAVWLLGSTNGILRGEALTRQEDVFVELSEVIDGLGADTPNN